MSDSIDRKKERKTIKGLTYHQTNLLILGLNISIHVIHLKLQIGRFCFSNREND